MTSVVVGRVGKAHGLKGEVTVQVRTDAPDERFVVGATFATDPPESGPLTVRTARRHNGVQLLAFEDAPDRSAAERLRGIELLAAADASEDEAWYSEDLVGLLVVDTSGAVVGRVRELITRPAQDLLEIVSERGGTAYVPFVEEIVPEVDVEGGRLVVDPPPGLLDLER